MTFKIEAGPRNAANTQMINSLDMNMKKGIRQGFFAAGSNLKDRARRNMLDGPFTGKIRRKRNSRRKHQASARGQTPHSDSGRTRKSIGFQIAGADSMQFGAGGRGSGVNWVKFLEPKDKLDRPLLGNAVRDNQAVTIRAFQDAISKAIDK